MQLTVITKIILGFALFGCLLLLTSILSYFGLNDIRNASVDVVEQKMPVQSLAVDVKTRILTLATITANGYHESSVEGLNGNTQQFTELSSPFIDKMGQLTKRLTNNPAAAGAQQASENYVRESESMYAALKSRLALENQIQQQLETVLRTSDEGSALMLDLSYLDPSKRGIETLIGAGTNVDNKLLTLNTALTELADTNKADVSDNIIADIEYQLSNLQVDKDYLNRLADSVDDGGTVAQFNEQYDLLVSEITGSGGLIDLQKQKLGAIASSNQHRAAASDALSAALEDINTLFDQSSEATLAGQTEILDTVQANLIKNLVVLVVGVLAAIGLGTVATRSIAKPLARINRGLSQLSRGDLSKKLEQSGNDEFAALAAKVNTLTDSLRELVGNILDQEEQLAAVTKESVSMGEKSLKDVDKQREQVRVTSTNTQHVRDTSRSNLDQINVAMDALNTVTEQSQQIAKLVDENRKQVDSQARQAEESAQIIHRLDENSRNIGSILDVIKTIAEQTNLLALNAAIEAARAGEQGRGFAVVADEVRTLANRTHNSTEEIEAMIASLQQDAEQAVKAITIGRDQAKKGVEITHSVSEQVKSVSEIIDRLSQINQHIVSDTRQQDNLLADVADSLNTIVALADSSAQSTRQANEASLQLDGQMDSLRRAVERFKLQ